MTTSPSMYGVLIADDEPLCRQYLVALIKQDPRFEPVAVCEGGIDAVAEAQRTLPAVAFLDVRMPRMDGFQALEAMRDSPPLIVFVTAYGDYAVKAYECGAFDYVTKPINPARFAQVLDRVHQRLCEREAATFGLLATRDALAELPPQTAYPSGKKLLSAVRQDLVYAESEIEVIESAGNYLHVRIRGERHLVRESLENFCRQLNSSHFARTHRSFVVNMLWVKKIRYGKSGAAELSLADGYRVPVSRRHRKEVAEFLRRILPGNG